MIRKSQCLVAAVVMLLAVSSPAAVADQASTEAPAGGIAGLSWLAGCWVGEGGEECWLAPRGGMMIAVNRAPAREGKLPFFELLRIVEDDEGLLFLAQPGGRAPATPFRAVEVDEQRVVFANPEHDFPQRLTYWREGLTLRVRVEARGEGGDWRGFEQVWSMASWPDGRRSERASRGDG